MFSSSGDQNLQSFGINKNIYKILRKFKECYNLENLMRNIEKK